MKSILVLIIVIGSFSFKAGAQQLASEKPIGSYYSKTTKQKISTTADARQPAATRSRQQLSSERAWPKPVLPSTIKLAPVAQRRSVAIATRTKTASEKPLDMDKINRQRARPH